MFHSRAVPAGRDQRARLNTGLAIEHGRDGIENLLRATVVLPEIIDAGAGRDESSAIFGEHRRLGVAESVDRLLDIADGKQSSTYEVDEFPLQTIGILEFVHQDL